MEHADKDGTWLHFYAFFVVPSTVLTTKNESRTEFKPTGKYVRFDKAKRKRSKKAERRFRYPESAQEREILVGESLTANDLTGGVLAAATAHTRCCLSSPGRPTPAFSLTRCRELPKIRAKAVTTHNSVRLLGRLMPRLKAEKRRQACSVCRREFFQALNIAERTRTSRESCPQIGEQGLAEFYKKQSSPACTSPSLGLIRPALSRVPCWQTGKSPVEGDVDTAVAKYRRAESAAAGEVLHRQPQLVKCYTATSSSCYHSGCDLGWSRR
ncbi:hypothetical protein J6590_077560 [Homalodisca vitripennis]|nr:hypothetical protein J6590_077560 [Homalodisca vitripennis]